MERKNEQLARYEGDPRFYVHLKPGEVGYQSSLPEYHQPVQTDWYAIREYLKSGKLPERGEKIEKIAARLIDMDPKFDEQGAEKTAYRIFLAIESGFYNNFCIPQIPIQERCLGN